MNPRLEVLTVLRCPQCGEDRPTEINRWTRRRHCCACGHEIREDT